MEANRDPLIRDLKDLPTPVAIFGGSFDPVHAGHIADAKAVLEQLKLAAVLFVPCAQNPLKANPPVGSDEHRLRLLQLALEDEQNLFVSSVELDRFKESPSQPSYTIDTVLLLRSLNLDKIYLMVGSELVPDLPKWQRIKELTQLVQLVVTERAGYPAKAALSALPTWLRNLLQERVIKPPHIDTSATEIRDLLRQGPDAPNDQLKAALKPAVLQYIRESCPEYLAVK